MTTKTRTFEGITSGTALSSSTNGTSDDAFSFVLPGTGGSITADNTRAAHGTISMKVVGASGVAAQVANSGLSTTTMAARTYVYFTASPTDDEWIQGFYASGGSTRIASWHLDSAGKLNLRNSGAGSLWVAPTAMPLNQWIRVEMFCQVGTTISNGTLNFAYYAADSATAIASSTNTANTNTGVANIDQVTTSRVNTGLYTTAFWIDDLKIDNAAAGFIGPVGAVVPPTITPAAAPAVVAGSAVSLTTTATSTSGTISTLTGTWSGPAAVTPTGSPSGTGTSTATLVQTATPTVPGVYTVAWDCTDSVGTHPTAPPSTKVYVAAASGSDVTPAAVTLGVWTSVGGAATPLAAITDALDSTWLESAAAPTTSQPLTITLGPHGLGRIDVIIKNLYFGASLTATANLYKADGTTLVSGPVAAAFNAAAAETTFSFAEATLTAVPALTDRTALVCTVTAS